MMANLPAGARAIWEKLSVAPEFSDPAMSQRAHMLHAVLLTVFATHGVLLLIGATFVFARKVEGGVLVAIVLLAAAVSHWLMRRGALGVASHVMAWTLWTVSSAMLLLSDAANVGLYIPVVIIAVVLLGPLWAVVICFLSAGVASLTIFGAELGLHLPRYFPAPPASRLLFFVTQSVLAVVPFYFIARGLTRALERAGRELAERARAQQDLQHSEQRYQTILNTMVEGVFMRGPRREVLIANPAARRILGVRPEDLHYETLRERGWRTLREDGTPFPESEFPDEVALRTGRPQYNVVMGIRRPDHTLTWISVNAQPVFETGASGPCAVVVTHADITERINARQLLERERMLLRILIDHLPDDIFTLDAAGRFSMVNSAWLAQHGVATDADVVGKSVFDMFEATMAGRVDAENRRILDTGVGLYNQSRSVPKPGGTRSILTSKIPMRDAGGKVVGIIGIIRDVTELNNALDTLQQERNLLRAIIDCAPDTIYVKDRQCRYVVMNEAGLRMRDVPRHDDIVGKTVRDYLPAAAADSIEREDRAVMDSGRPLLNAQRKSRERQGADRWISVSKFPLLDTGGAVVGLVTISRDITDLRSIIEEVRDLNLQLEDRVKIRTQELQDANKELEAFSYSVSHDLRAPLRSISGFGSFLLKDNFDQLDAQGKERLQRILAATARMGRLIDDLLKLARISRQTMSVRQVRLHALAAEIVAGLREAGAPRQVEVVIGEDLTVEADAGLMRVVLDNLLGNAWKFTGGLSEARIEFGAEETAGRRTFYVRDNGAGFDMSYAGKLFAPFQRMHTQQQFEGTGIGLATVKRIIERHQGRIWIESAVGRGTTVFFTLGRPA